VPGGRPKVQTVRVDARPSTGSPATAVPPGVAGRVAGHGVGPGDRPLLRVPWPALLGPLPPADAEALERLAVRRTVEAGCPIFARGAAAPALLALVDGQAATGRRTDRGPHAEHVAHGPSWLALAWPWHAHRHGLDAWAVGDVVLAELPLEPLRSLVARRPLIAQRLLDAAATEVVRLDRRLDALRHQDAAARLADWLRAHGTASGGVVRLAERKRDIATQLGMTPETLSRLMRSLSQRGLIEVNGYTVRVLDDDGLHALAAG
jgi:CRP-like cAMP-binding protein